MVAFTFAGQYGPQAVLDRNGNAQPGASASLYETDGLTLATVYTSRAKTAAGQNPFPPDGLGNLSFFADPGSYVLKITVATVVTVLNVEVPVDPAEPRTNDLAFLIAYGG